MFVECTEKTGVSGFGLSGQGDNPALRGRRRLPKEKMQLAGSKEGGLVILNGIWKSKMEIPVRLVQYIKLAMAEPGLGSETVRAPRLPVEGREREEILSI